MIRRSRPAMGTLLYFSGAILLGLYFTFAAVQGDYGVFRRGEILAQKYALQEELAQLDIEVTQMENLTHRLSDSYLDLDLLDQQPATYLA